MAATSGASGPDDHDHGHGRLASSLTARYSDWVLEALDELPGSFLLTDPALPGHPIVYASGDLAVLTGYAPRDVLGRNTRVFQGAATDRAAVAHAGKVFVDMDKRGQCGCLCSTPSMLH